MEGEPEPLGAGPHRSCEGPGRVGHDGEPGDESACGREKLNPTQFQGNRDRLNQCFRKYVAIGLSAYCFCSVLSRRSSLRRRNLLPTRSLQQLSRSPPTLISYADL